MSLAAVQAFRARVAADAGLQQLCADAVRDGAWPRIVEAAAARGLVFTEQDLLQVVGAGELSDLELELVAGGGDPGFQSGYVKNPYQDAPRRR